METYTLNNGVKVLAKPNGDPLSYGNRTAANKRRDALIASGECPHAYTYQAASPARGFYVGVEMSQDLLREEAPLKVGRLILREEINAALAHEDEWNPAPEGTAARDRIAEFLALHGDAPAAIAAYEIARAEFKLNSYGRIVRRGTAQAAILQKMIEGCGNGGNAIAPIPGVSVKGLMRRARRQVALDRAAGLDAAPLRAGVWQ